MTQKHQENVIRNIFSAMRKTLMVEIVKVDMFIQVCGHGFTSV